jgi:hypothetical protein
MGKALSAPRAPGVKSVAQRNAERTVFRHASIVDEVDTVIDLILDDAEYVKKWELHNDPVFDDESSEGDVEIDKVRLADLVIEKAKGDFPQIDAATTKRVKLAVQAALRRNSGSVRQRRLRIVAKTAAE